MKRVFAYRYRWFVLLGLVLMVIAVEIPWMNLASLGRSADAFYGGGLGMAGVLALIYMACFVVFAIPASLVIAHKGVVFSSRLACLLAAIASLLRLASWRDANWLMVSQALYALAQTIVLNLSATAVARWFPIRERGMAMGIASSMQYMTLGLSLVIPGFFHLGLQETIVLGAWSSAAAALLGSILIRENPPTPSSLVEPATFVPILQGGVKPSGTPSSLRGVTLIFAISWGVLMAMLSRLDLIADQIKVDNTSALGLTILLSGAVGAVVIPALSDYFRQRKKWYVLAHGLSLPGLMLMAVAPNPLFAYVGSGIFGFFAFSALPIGQQYAAEVGWRYSETRIQSRMTLFSQLVGAFVLFGSMGVTMVEVRYDMAFYVGLLLACFVGSTFLSESPMIITEDERLDKEINKEIVQTE